MKFDVVVGNPPYKAGVHLDFLKNAIELCNDAGHILFVHPSEWLVQKRPDDSVKRKKYRQLRDIFSKKCTNISFIDNVFGENAKLFVPLCITHTENTNGNCTFSDERTCAYGVKNFVARNKQKIDALENVTRWIDAAIEAQIISKIFEKAKNDNWLQHMGMNDGNHYISLSSISGSGETLINKNDKKFKLYNMYSLGNKYTLNISSEPQIAKAQGKREKGNIKPFVSLQTHDEAKHALDFIMCSKIMRAYIAMIKAGQNAANALMHLIPWLDWTKTWNDEKLYDYFDLSLDEIEVIEKIWLMLASEEK